MDAITRIAILIVLAVGLFVPAGCRDTTAQTVDEHAPKIRVKLLAGTDQVLVGASGRPLFKSSSESDPHHLHFAGTTPVLVTLASDGWHIGNLTIAAGELTIVPETIGSVSVAGKAYRGTFRLRPTSANHFDVINDVDIDSYLKSVVTGEMPRTFLDEAYKAQAIVARTYALYESNKEGTHRDYDVFADVKSQVYAGFTAETARSRAAVDETSGIVVAAGAEGQERIFKAYFSACCGGIGQSAADAFGDDPSKALMEQNVGALCNESPRYNWAPVELRKDELTRRIHAWGINKGRPEKDMALLSRIDASTFNQFGRPVRFVFTDVRGVKYSLTGEEARWACNADANGGPMLLSSFFKPVNGTDTVRFTDGHGYGHGVGLCQWCAQARAEHGMRHEDIVILSYPGSKLVRAY